MVLPNAKFGGEKEGAVGMVAGIIEIVHERRAFVGPGGVNAVARRAVGVKSEPCRVLQVSESGGTLTWIIPWACDRGHCHATTARTIAADAKMIVFIFIPQFLFVPNRKASLLSKLC